MITDIHSFRALDALTGGRVIAVTGHRPNKLGGYESKATEVLATFARTVVTVCQARLFLIGMAIGWDQAMARACINGKVDWSAYIPFPGQEKVWPDRSRVHYEWLMERCTDKKVCSLGGFSARKMQIRNRMMVDDCDILLALWDGSEGGTANCIEYAEQVGTLTINVWPLFKELADIHGITLDYI